jgi:valine--pyruvate aminotransferase
VTTFSNIGSRLSAPSGIQELMDDLGQSMTSGPDMRMLGGGQPAAIPSVQAVWRSRFKEMLEDGTALDRSLLNYDPPLGNPLFRETFAAFLKRECSWDVTAENVAVLPSSQTAFFLLFNLLAGESAAGRKRILLPLAPEYIGYANQGLGEEMFVSLKPLIEDHGTHEFKYRVDFDRLRITPDIAAICVSCPTNPSGNVISAEEFARLRDLARHHGIPFIVDNAYGHPFPNVVHSGFAPHWEPGMVFSISMSKVGLPGVRTAMIVGPPEIVSALGRMNAIVSLANGNLGQALLQPLLRDDTLPRLSRETIRPFYREKTEYAVGLLTSLLGEKISWSLHAREGAFFLWLWLKDMSCTSAEFYQRLKQRRVLIIPGHYFFFGLNEPGWKHARQCLRITVSQNEKTVREGLEILADEAVKVAG